MHLIAVLMDLGGHFHGFVVPLYKIITIHSYIGYENYDLYDCMQHHCGGMWL